MNVDLLFISSLSPRAVLAGKLMAAAALALLIFSACAPFMTFAYVMRGLDVPTILVVLTADYLAVLLGTTFALFLASVPANRGLRILLGLFGFIGMCYIGAGLLAFSAAFLRGTANFEMSSWEFWLGCLGVIGVVFGSIGLLFAWAVALISPPAANRAYFVRAYTLGLWVVGFAGFAAWSLYIKMPEPVGVWGMLGCALFSLHIVIGVCERDHWGARVARRIPHAAVLRAPAFLFYSGAAGGIAFGVIGATLSVLGIVLWMVIVPSTRTFSAEAEMATVAGLIAGYAYCYSLTAAVFRRMFNTSSVFRPGYTWVIALLIFGLGCVAPYLVQFALFDRPRYGNTDDTIALYLINPFVMIDDAIRRTDSHLPLTVVFLIAWSTLATLVNAPWLMKQVANFRPPDVEPEPEFEVEERE